VSTATTPNPVASQYVFARWPTTDEELYWWVAGVWGFRIPNTQVCPNHSTPFAAFAEAFFARVPVSVWKASRGLGGKSNTLALLVLSEAVILGSQASILGGSAAQSLNVHGVSTEAWASPNAPKSILVSANKWDTYLSNGAHIRSLTASQTSVRGPHPQRLRLDEIDEMELAILEGAQGQPMRKKNQLGQWVESQTVMSSTHQYPDKTMTEMLRRAKENGWPIHEWCYRESSNPVDGWLRAEDVEKKRKEIPKHMWDTEYDLQEPSFEGRAIDTEKVNICFSPILGNFDDKVMQWEIEPPIDGMRYVTGVDWAKEKDWTVITTFNVTETPWRAIASERVQRIPWPAIVHKAQRRLERYGGFLIHDGTGIGNVVGDYITYPKELVRGPSLNGAFRSQVFSDYIAAIEDSLILYPRWDWAYDEHRYATVEDLYGPGHPPDSFVAGALAWSIRKQQASRLVIPKMDGAVRESSPWMMR
jgi:hypothetical protein